MELFSSLVSSTQDDKHFLRVNLPVAPDVVRREVLKPSHISQYASDSSEQQRVGQFCAERSVKGRAQWIFGVAVALGCFSACCTYLPIKVWLCALLLVCSEICIWAPLERRGRPIHLIQRHSAIYLRRVVQLMERHRDVVDAQQEAIRELPEGELRNALGRQRMSGDSGYVPLCVALEKLPPCDARIVAATLVLCIRRDTSRSVGVLKGIAALLDERCRMREELMRACKRIRSGCVVCGVLVVGSFGLFAIVTWLYKGFYPSSALSPIGEVGAMMAFVAYATIFRVTSPYVWGCDDEQR